MAEQEGVGVMQEWQYGNTDMLEGISAYEHFNPSSPWLSCSPGLALQ